MKISNISTKLILILCMAMHSVSSFSFAVQPNEIPGLRLWLDAQDTTTFVGENNHISEWINKADPLNPAQQPSAENQPAYTGDGLNGKPGAYFDGVGKFLALPSSIRETAGPYQLFIFAQGETGGDKWARLFSSYSEDGGDQWIAPNTIFMAPNNAGTPTAFEGQWLHQGGMNHVLQNITLGSDAKLPGISNFKGYIGEILLFDRKLSNTQFNQMVDYLIDHWGLSSGYSPPEGVDLTPRLRDLGEALGVDMGNISASNFHNFADTEIYQKVLGENFGILSPENDLKFGLLSSSQGTYNFTAVDRHVAFAEANNMKLHGHVFVWHSQLPAWLDNGTWTRTQLIDILNNHIDTVGGYLKGKVAVWDVVNEPFNDGDGSWRSTVWNDVIDAGNAESHQRDFIDLAFQRARQVDPDAKLILNDYSNEVINAKSDAMYAWAQSMVARGIPLDGVGFQMHLSGPIDYDSFSQNMQRFADLGLEIHITELDVRIMKPFTTEKSLLQAEIYREVLNRALDQPAVKSFTTWGFTDAYSWIPSWFIGTDDALLFDRDYHPKHAFVAVQEELMAHLSADRLRTRLLGKHALSPNAALDKDFDNDGLSTLFELAMNLDPQTPDRDKHPIIESTEDQTTMRFVPRAFTTDIEIRVEYSTDWENWQVLAKRPAGSQSFKVIKNGTQLSVNPDTGEVTVNALNHGVPYFTRIAVTEVAQE